MMRTLLFAVLILLVPFCAMAQLPNGATAPNWSMTDINGQSHNLYDYLDNEKVVFLDFSATWCGPCWNYHNTHSFANLYDQYGPAGTNNVMAFMIEGDATTNTNCLYGPSGCNASTQGNWVSGTPYPIIDNASINGPYQINYWPTIYGVCPDKKITEVGQVGTSSLWNFAQGCSAPQLTTTAVNHINCFGQNNGAIMVNLNGGISPFTYAWSNGASTKDLINIPAGSYTVTVTGSLGGTSVMGPIVINQPSAPLSTHIVSQTNAGCNGIGGTAQIGGSGGTANYSYLWSNGSTSSSQFNLQPGNYSVTTTDANGCTHVLSNIVIDPPTIPQAIAESPTIIDCINTEVYLSGLGSTQGPNLSYAWSTSNGNIVSGATTLDECLVDEPGTYNLLIIDNESSCQATASTITVASINLPTTEAGDPAALDCDETSATLEGSASGGANLEYLWTTVGGNIVSGATTLTPVVDDDGDYFLTVTNLDNGCSSTDETEVVENTTPPNAQTTGGELTCTTTEVTLEGSSSTSGASFEWSGPGNFSSTNQDITVSTPGIYTLVVTNSMNGCTNSAEAEAIENTTPPNASANGGEITCTTTEVTLEGNSTTSGVSYEWSGPGNFSSNAQSPTVGTPGNYTLTVTGQNGCTKTALAAISENTTTPTASAGNEGLLNCNATSVVLNGAGSSSGNQYSYIWSTPNGNIVSGENTTTPTVDEPGEYNIEVTNTNNGCVNTASTTVTETSPVETEISSQTNVQCFGGNGGAAEVSVAGGNGSYTYAWSNGETSATITGLSAGTYTVVVTDGEDCSSSEEVEITEPNELSLSTSSTAQTAPGINDGTATADASGGTGTLSYLWSNGETTASISDLAPGNYTVEVTDINGCVKTQTVTVNEFGCAVSADISSESVTCNGFNDGTANINLNNSAEPVTYLWSNDETTANISDLTPGTYSVTASDGNGCEIVASVDVDEPATLVPNTTSTAVTSANAEDGTATANPTGGTGPFTYEWSNGETTQTITNLPSANYTVIVTDANGCVSEQTVPVAPANCSMLANITSNNVSCFGANDGTATVTLNGGLSPFTYLWSNDETSPTISNLSPGTYTVEVTDAVGCPALTEVTIDEPTELEGTIVSQSNADCGVANGTVTLEASGGTPGYEYNWSNGLSGASQNDLEPGDYSIAISDGNDCTVNVNVEIGIEDNEPPVVTTQNISVEIAGAGTVEITPSQIDGGSTDNCDIAGMELSISSFDCSNLGEQEVTLTVTDEAGNSSEGTAIVTVIDEIAPEIAVQNITLGLDASGLATLSPNLIDNGSSDNCGIADMSVDIAEFDCDDIGDNAVVLTVVDDSGNSSSGTAIVTIVDDVAPTIACSEDMVLPYCDPVAEIIVVAQDNCSSNLSYQWSHPNGSTFPSGTTTVQVTVADENGNTGSCSLIVTVPDEMSINMLVGAISCPGESNGSLSAEVSGGAPEYSYLWSNGETTPTIENVGSGVYGLSVTDAAGCQESFEFVLEEPVPVEAEAEIQNEIGTQENGGVDVSISGGASPYEFEWTNANGDVVSNSEDLSGVAAGTYTLVVTDANGCTSEHVYTVESVVTTIDQQLAAKINLFPNPTSGQLTLTFEDVNETEALIMAYSLTGQVLMENVSVNIGSGFHQLDFSAQPSGVYIIKVLIGDRLATKRVVVSK